MYRTDQSESVIDRLNNMADAVRAQFAITYGLSGLMLGVIVGALVAVVSSVEVTIPTIVCGLIGGVAGAGVGISIANGIVVWVEWGAQVLSGIDALAREKAVNQTFSALEAVKNAGGTLSRRPGVYCKHCSIREHAATVVQCSSATGHEFVRFD